METSEYRAFAHLKNTAVHEVLKRQYEKLSLEQRSIKDEIDLRWNQGKQQMLFEILETIDKAKAEVERIESASIRPRPTANAF